MKLCLFTAFFLINLHTVTAQQCRFEKSNGQETATYFEAIEWYRQLDKISSKVMMKEAGETDAGYPLHLVMVSNDGIFNPAQWHAQHRVVILINNGIHPGEPDGIDASMMLVRDIVNKKTTIPNNVVLALIPVYNIGGCLNRSSFTRVNQNGPLEYGFRGNSQNLDLNRDFSKCDTKEAKSFTKLFHSLDPDILIDNHVSDGADYQYTMTLITTQYEKLGGQLGTWLQRSFEPQLFKNMSERNWEMTPYVNFETASPDIGMEMFYDPPRYSSGYAALFATIGFIPETHMLKPFADRVKSTYALMQSMIATAGKNADTLIVLRNQLKKESIARQTFPMSFSVDSSKFGYLIFKGYEQAYATSEATGLQKMYYDRNKPFAKKVKYYNVFKPGNNVAKPLAYIIPQGWYTVIDLLKMNQVQMRQFTTDTSFEVEAYHITGYKSYPTPYEKHHKNYSVKVSADKQKMQFLKGDYIILLNQPANRYLVEMLEPTGDDSFFAWNFFDAVLQQKEGYSDYRWEDIAATVVKNDPELKQKLEAKKLSDTGFAKNSSAQLDFIYKNSPYYEPMHLRYPVYRLLQ
jgi:hypothetical protein